MRHGFSHVDTSVDPDTMVGYLDVMANHLAVLKADHLDRLEVSPGSRVLDIGCGAGHDLAAVAERQGTPVGIDPSSHMVGVSRRRLLEADLPALLARGGGEALPFASACFDGCHIERVLQHAKDPAEILRETRRVLRQGARVVIFEPDWSSLVIEGDDVRVADAITCAVMSGVRHPQIGAELADLVGSAGFGVTVSTTDEGVARSVDGLYRMFNVESMLVRAVWDGLLSQSQADTWFAEMHERSRSGTFRATVARTTVVARA